MPLFRGDFGTGRNASEDVLIKSRRSFGDCIPKCLASLVWQVAKLYPNVAPRHARKIGTTDAVGLRGSFVKKAVGIEYLSVVPRNLGCGSIDIYAFLPTLLLELLILSVTRSNFGPYLIASCKSSLFNSCSAAYFASSGNELPRSV